MNVFKIKLKFLEGKLGRCLILTFLKLSFLNFFVFEVESTLSSDENCF